MDMTRAVLHQASTATPARMALSATFAQTKTTVIHSLTLAPPLLQPLLQHHLAEPGTTSFPTLFTQARYATTVARLASAGTASSAWCAQIMTCARHAGTRGCVRVLQRRMQMCTDMLRWRQRP